MSSLLKFLLNQTSPYCIRTTTESKLIFDLCEFSIRVVFGEDDGSDAYEECLDEKQESFDYERFLKSHRIKSVIIAKTEVFSEEEENITFDSAYYLEMYEMVRRLNIGVPNCVQSYWVEERVYDDCGWSMGCPISMEYGWFISINEAHWNETSVQLILDIVEKNNQKYWIPFTTDKETSMDIGVILTNTKARRLGYLKLFLTAFKEKNQQSLQSFINWLSSELDSAENALLMYKNDKGVIRRRGKSLNIAPYLDVAIDLGLLVKRGEILELGKLGKVYLELGKQYDDSSNIFELSNIDKSVFLESILLNDYLYISIIIEYAYISSSSSYKDLKTRFQELVLNRIRGILNSGKIVSFMDTLTLRNLDKRISSWTKAEVYLEHVLMPRLNWLYDLDIINLNKDLSFTLTKSGIRLFRHLAICLDINQSQICKPHTFFQHHYMQMFCDIYSLCANLGEFDEKNYCEVLFTECNSKFKSLAPNRVTYSIFVSFCKRKMLMEHRLIVEESAIRDYLESSNHKYIFKYQQYYKDGYIQKK